MLTQEQPLTHYNAMHPLTRFQVHPTCKQILMCDTRGDGAFFTLCHAPVGMKWLITKVKNLLGKLEWRADAAWILCPSCEKITNDYGHCTTKYGCYYF